MPTLTLDVALFSVFLALNLIVGLKYRGKTQTFKEYAIGDKKFSTATLTATIVATWLSGSALFIVLENTYGRGLYYIIAKIIGFTGALFIIGCVIGPRMGKFLNNVSVPDALGTLYGRHVQAIAGISAVLKSIGYIAIQFKVISKILTILLNYEGPWVTIISATIIILYSASGGVKAVTFTDVIQFITFGTLLPVLALVIWHHLKDPTQVAQMLHHNPLFSFKEVVGWTPEFMGTLLLMCYYITPQLPPQLFQRIAMARDVTQVKRSMTYAAIVCLAVNLCMTWIAILLLVDQPGLAPRQVVQYMVHQYTYPGLKGFLGIGVIALAMSTADSALNSCAVIMANDLLPALRPQQKSSLKVARWATFGLGGLALLIALRELDLLDLILLSAGFHTPIVVIPMLLAIFGFQTSRRVVFMAMGAGFTTVVACLAYFKSVNTFFPGMIANGIVLMGAHYLLGEKGGWGHNPVEGEPTPLLQHITWKERLAAARRFKLYPYLERVLPQQEYAYLLLGLYIFTTTYALFYLLPQEVAFQYPGLYRGIQYSVTLITTSFLAFPIWPKPLQSKRCFVWIWPITIFYTLFVVGGLLVIMSGFSLPQMLLLALNFVMLLLLLHWPLVLGTAISGILVAILFFKQYTGLESLPGDLGSIQFKIIYGLLLLSSFLIALFKHKQDKAKLEDQNVSLLTTHQETTSELLVSSKDRARFIKAFRASGAPALARLVGLSKEIIEKTKGFNLPQELTQEITQLHEELTPIALHLDRLDHRAIGYLRLEVGTIPIDAFVQAVQEKLHAKGLAKRIHWRRMTQHKELQCDVARMESLLVNSVSFMRAVGGEDTPILIGLEDTQLGYPLNSVKPNYTKHVAALRLTLTTARMLPALEEHYLAQMSEDTFPMPETTTDLPLVANERILKAHYGYASTMGNGKALTQLYVIPVKLRKVRPKDMDLPEMELGAELTRADDTYPGAQEQEAAFLKAVQEGTQADLKLIRKAIDLIKEYHGPARRKSGEPFYLHPLAVAQIVLDYNQEEATVLGALLHDTVEDTPLTPDQIAMRFNEEVRNIVDGVTHLDSHKDTFYKVKLSSHENVRMLLGIADQRVLYVKIADRMHNMRKIQYKPYKSQRRTAEETLLFFVPLAEHLGLKEAAAEFKELCFEVLTS